MAWTRDRSEMVTNGRMSAWKLKSFSFLKAEVSEKPLPISGLRCTTETSASLGTEDGAISPEYWAWMLLLRNWLRVYIPPAVDV